MVAAGAVLWAIGHFLGTRSLQQLGFALVTLTVLAVLLVRRGRHDVSVERRVTPGRARARQLVTAELTIVNRGKGSAPLLLMEDAVPTSLGGRARFSLYGIEAGGKRETNYAVRPERRGRYELGPLTAYISDPFGLARIRSHAAARSSFLVHPAVETLSLPRDTGERRTAAASLRQPTGPRGEDFYTLREYVEGDDLRKIHWPSTAKRQKYMIRQEETPWQTRATIVLDDRSSAHDGSGGSSSFERAVEGAASFLDLYHRAGYAFRLAGAHEPGFPHGKGGDHAQRCLDLLALIETRGPRRDDPLLLARLTEIEARGAAEETLVLLTGRVDPDVASALSRCRRRYKSIVVVWCAAHRFGAASTKERWAGESSVASVAAELARSGIAVVVLGPDERLGRAWRSAGTRRSGQVTWAQKPELV